MAETKEQIVEKLVEVFNTYSAWLRGLKTETNRYRKKNTQYYFAEVPKCEQKP